MANTALRGVIRALTEAREAAIDADEAAARADMRLVGVTFPVASLDVLIEALQATEEFHAVQMELTASTLRFSRRVRWLGWASLVCAVASFLFALMSRR
jgi:hypothetical protein